jgi:hypothetical protein
VSSVPSNERSPSVAGKPSLFKVSTTERRQVRRGMIVTASEPGSAYGKQS